jgi:chemotaxis protein methyltransferase CheR
MSQSFGTHELQLFQSAIARRLGLRFDDGKLTFLAEVLADRSDARRMDPMAYLDALVAEREADAEIGELARRLTVGETYFFRHSEQFNAVRELVLPERVAARAQARSLRLLSVGCASGEEAYTLAILAREHVPPAFDVGIHGLDVNPDALAKARAGLYSSWSLRETPANARERWFTVEDRNFRLARSLRESVRFSEQNLVDAGTASLPPETYDVIFCRNVLMYFTPEHMANIVERLTRALVPGGFLFLGHAETLRGLSQAFHLRHTHNTFYYQRKDVLDSGEPVVLGTLPSFGDAPSVAPNGEWVGTWLESVERSSARIRALSHADADTEAQRAKPVHQDAQGSQKHLKEPLELLQSERFSEALALMHQLPEPQSSDPTSLLLRAALLTHQGELGPAELACQRLLEVDELNAGAHYLLALCRERQEDLSAAAEHDLTAIYLDSGFAMPHLHLGLMARRRRDVEVARRELTQALWLLEREDASRLLLFGGGFARNALLALCRSELERLRSSP